MQGRRVWGQLAVQGRGIGAQGAGPPTHHVCEYDFLSKIVLAHVVGVARRHPGCSSGGLPDKAGASIIIIKL